MKHSILITLAALTLSFGAMAQSDTTPVCGKIQLKSGLSKRAFPLNDSAIKLAIKLGNVKTCNGSERIEAAFKAAKTQVVAATKVQKAASMKKISTASGSSLTL